MYARHISNHADPALLTVSLYHKSFSMAHRSRQLVVTILVIWSYLFNTVAAIEITGATGGVNYATGERPSRQEISTFVASGAAYDLFILALRQLQSTNQSEPLSYFQIAGIHGYPQIPWDGVVGYGSYAGFCTHSAVVFPTWHRPYVALFEVKHLGFSNPIC
jgi:tyrosinase